MLRKFLCLVVVVFLSGCGVLSDQPLTDPLTEEPDEALYGHWVATYKDEFQHGEVHLFIGPGTRQEELKLATFHSPFMSIAMVIWEDKDGVMPSKIHENISGYVTVSRIGKASYANFYTVISGHGNTERNLLNTDVYFDRNLTYEYWKKDPRKAVMILRYAVQRNRLTIWQARVENYKKQEILLEAGVLQEGKPIVSSDGKTTKTPITFDSLFRYLRKNDGGAELFGDAITFTKVP